MTKTFSKQGDFQAYYEACDWLTQQGISYGSMCRGEPIALVRGEVFIAKWHNLDADEKAECDGTMTGDFRHGPVTVTMKEDK